MQYISSVYGNAYAPFALVFLHSLTKNSPGDDVTIYWQDIDDDIIEALSSYYRNVVFVKTYFDMPQRAEQRIPVKMLIWNQAVSSCATPLCLIDSDTIVAKPLSSFFEDGFDIIFTDKREQFQINTGVMLVKPCAAVQKFFSSWTQRTMDIVNNSELLAVAVSPEHHYGAADQMAFYEAIRYSPGVKEYSVPCGSSEVKLKSVDCNILNQTNSVPLNNSIFVYHYKGGWRNIILNGMFYNLRPKFESTPMLIQYITYYSDAMDCLKNHGISDLTLSKIKCYKFSPFALRCTFFLEKIIKAIARFIHVPHGPA